MRIRLSAETKERLKSLHPELKRRVRTALDDIAGDPAKGKPLQGELEGLLSYRVGRFRIIYSAADEGILDVLVVGSRQSIYEEAEALRLLRKPSG